MVQYYKIKKLKPFGARFYLHWSVFGGIGFCLLNDLDQPLLALISVVSYLSVLLVHESGHALMAKRLGYPVLEMRLSIIHGTCTHGGDLWSEWHDVAIAWGGVLAQFVVAGAMFLLSIIPGLGRAPAIAPIFAFLGPISIFIALFNLIPIPPLDGAKAWRIVPLLFERWRPGRRMKSRKRSPFGPVK